MTNRIPPMPWARYEDGDRLGWFAVWLWIEFLLPSRAAFLTTDERGNQAQGPWVWERPKFMERPTYGTISKSTGRHLLPGDYV